MTETQLIEQRRRARYGLAPRLSLRDRLLILLYSR